MPSDLQRHKLDCHSWLLDTQQCWFRQVGPRGIGEGKQTKPTKKNIPKEEKLPRAVSEFADLNIKL